MSGAQRDRPTLGLIHTVDTLPAVFDALAEAILPGVAVLDRVDESLLADAGSDGLTPEIERRLAGHIDAHIDAGADVIMVTCSSMGPLVDRLAEQAEVPVVRVDAAMVRRGLESGGRVGVLATLQTTMSPTVELVHHCADRSHRDVAVVAHLCDGAFDALKAGDVTRHDRLVEDGLRAIETEVDVVVLAQASMARVLLADGFRSRVPILSSPRLAVERLRPLFVHSQAEKGS